MKEEKHVAKIKSKNNRTYILFFLKTFLTYIFMRDFYTIYIYMCVCFTMWPDILSINVRGTGRVTV